MKRITLLGVTGQTGAGKSTVCGMIKEMGIPVIDADMVSRDVVAAGGACLAEIALEFGLSVIEANGTLNRKKLGSIVFSDSERLKALNAIIFPYIIAEIDRRLSELYKGGKHKLAVVDAPTLFESGLDKNCDVILSVMAPAKVRENRIIIRDHLTDEEARSRMSSQPDDEFYSKRSDYVLTNTGDLEALKSSLREVLSQLGAEFETPFGSDFL